MVPVEAATDEAGVTWVHFPVRTGLGDGEMVLRMQGLDVVLPLGARPGEFDMTLSRSTERPDEAERAAARVRSETSLEAEAAAWREGNFLLKDGADVVGEIRFMGGAHPPMVSVHDPIWLTPDPVGASRRDDSGDLLLQFPVEPTVESELGLLRINLVTRQVTVPTGAVPEPALDRRLQLVPGALSDEEREQAIQSAVVAADEMEAALLDEQLPRLLDAAQGAGCVSLNELGEPWTLMLKGYTVSISQGEGKRCRVLVDPELKQHRRRLTRERAG